MNILYIVQQSIYGNDGKWRTADSNVNMMLGMLRSVLKDRPDWNFYILIGKLDDFYDIDSYDELFKHPNVYFIQYNFPVDAFFNRQHFNVKEFESIWKILPKIDVVWNNITEISRNIKTFLYYKKEKSRLITPCYWLDAPTIGQEKVPMDISYDWRQFDGFECSDLAVFTCESTYEAWQKNAKNKFQQHWIDSIIKKSTIWDFGFSVEELQSLAKNEPFEKKTILFLNRLSSINYTHHEEFIEAMNILQSIRKENDWQVVFTNPSQKFSWDELKSRVPNLHLYKDGKALNREEYATLLKNAFISAHLFKKELYGGCSNVESLYSGNIAIMPKVYEYAKRADETYPGFINDIDPWEIAQVVNTILDMDNDTLKAYIKSSRDKVVAMSSFEIVGKKVINDIEQIV